VVSINFDQLLSRLDEETVQDILGKSTIELITLLDPNYNSPSKLKDLLVNIHGADGILLSKEIRNKIYDVLPLEEAEDLVNQLPASGPDPYQALKSYNPQRGSSQEEELFEFFGLEQPSVKKKVQRPSEENVYPERALYFYQKDALERLKDKLSNSPHRALLHMPTGSGKTRTAMHLVAGQLKQSQDDIVIWLADSSELCEQAAQEFQDTWSFHGDHATNIYRFWGSHELEINENLHGLVVAGLSKLYNKIKEDINFLPKLGEKCELIIMDEAHMAIAETYSLVLDTLETMREDAKLLGLTATPGRTWADIDKDQKLADYFNRKKVSIEIEGYNNPVDYLIDEGFLARPQFETLLHQPGIDLSEDDIEKLSESYEKMPISIIESLASDAKRNLAIVNEIEELAKNHNRILVFALTVNHSDLLAGVLKARDYKAYSITGETHRNLRKRQIKKYKENSNDTRILCNYGVLTKGFDAPQTSAALITRPTKSLVLYSQMIGRAIRGPKVGGNEEAKIVTVVDQNLPGFRNVSEAFQNWEDVWGD